MRLTIRIGALVAAALAAALSGGITAQASHAARKPSPPRIGLRHTTLGTLLVGPNGHTLYLNQADHGAASTCSGGCLAIWPVFRSRVRPIAGRGVHQRLIRVWPHTHRGQVSYAGHLLYYFDGDTAPGQVTGEGIGGFYVVNAAGKAVKARTVPATSPPPSTPPTAPW
jgi:predicted lipoprotein with Yx(FWY)xxD motif